jgi:hypothetical protein
MNDFEYKHQLYSEIDVFLSEIKRGNVGMTEYYRKEITVKPWFGIFKSIVFDKKLAETHDSVAGRKFVLTYEGMKAFDAGGIRQYLLDYDTSIRLKDGFPKVLIVTSESGIAGGYYYVANLEEESNIREQWNDYIITERRSIRDERPAIEDIRPTANYTFNGDISNFQNNYHTSGSNQLNVNPPPPATQEGRWSKTGVIVGIIAVMVAIVGVYFAWKALAPGH